MASPNRYGEERSDVAIPHRHCEPCEARCGNPLLTAPRYERKWIATPPLGVRDDDWGCENLLIQRYPSTSSYFYRPGPLVDGDARNQVSVETQKQLFQN